MLARSTGTYHPSRCSAADFRRLAARAALMALLATAAPIDFSQNPVPQNQTTQTSQSLPTGSQGRASNTLVPGDSYPSDSNYLRVMNEARVKRSNYEAANIERKRQITEDSARLLKLATELKAEVDKTGKDTLSLSVIRKAETIEMLAKGVKEKMKLTVGAN